jgi:hypothetical protein
MFGWFGRAAQDKSIMAWGCRAIFHPFEKHCLDIVWDRQGMFIEGHPSGQELSADENARWTQFAEAVNTNVMPKVRELAGTFGSDSSDSFLKHFPWPHDESLVLVADGSPQASYGYFYLSVSLVRKAVAPAEKKTEMELHQERVAERRREIAAENERLRPLIRKQMTEQRQRARVFRAEISVRIAGRRPLEDGSPLEAGDYLSLWINQGDRDAFVLAVGDGADGGKALVEYFMPNGNRSMRIIDVDCHDNGRPISEKSLPAKWRKRIDAQLAEV